MLKLFFIKEEVNNHKSERKHGIKKRHFKVVFYWMEQVRETLRVLDLLI